MTVDYARYTLQDVRLRDGKSGARLWIVIKDLVYDVTDYVAGHPGGPELIEEYAGRDATVAFDDFGHSSDAKRMLKDYLVGELVDEDKAANRKKKNGTKSVESETTRRRAFLGVLCGKCIY